jgi:G1/S-specific cyclin-E1
LKRHGSDSSQTSSSSPDTPLLTSSFSPVLIVSSDSSDDDGKLQKSTIHTINKTYIISKESSSIGEKEGKEGECSSGNQRDSLTVVYSSSSFKNSNSSNSNSKKVVSETIFSPVDSTASVLSEVDAVPSVDVDDIVSDYSAFSPLENEALRDEEHKKITTKNEKTPHSLRKRTSNFFYKTSIGDKLPCYFTPTSEQRVCPLPVLTWADRESVWTNMVRKDAEASNHRDENMFDKHPGLQPRMRAILLDWLIEVCEVYKLHRETYYLTVDYLDRYLTTAKSSISKNQLQLIGITCLFIASKVEEIYPPKLHEFAYVTDGACSEEDILQQEILILQALNWSITPVTIMGWLSIYMQLNATVGKTDVAGIEPKALLLLNSSKWSKSFIYPQFTGVDFARTAQLIDLCSLDVGIANFPYSVIAAAAISHTLDKTAASKVSGLDWATLAPCVKWMEPYFQVLDEEADINPIMLLEQNDQVEMSYGISHICPQLNKDPSHIIQTHSTSLDIFVSYLSANFIY